MSLTLSDLQKLVPDAVEHLYDFSYLGTHPLAGLRVVATMAVRNHTPTTHVDRGRALSKTLQVAIDELMPTGEPANVGRESRFFTLLYQAYREGKENREIALALSISERTFYRERLRALHALAQIVWDMETAAL
jgi:hypothetical protein